MGAHNSKAATALLNPAIKIEEGLPEDQVLSQYGGKAANLAKLAAAGLPVPGAFCVKTSEYKGHVSTNAELLESIQTILSSQKVLHVHVLRAL